MNYKKNILVICGFAFVTHIYNQQLHFKTTCEDYYCAIMAYDTQDRYVGYIQLDGCRISYVKVFFDFRRQGIAKALLAQARAQAALHNCKKVNLVSLKELVGYYQRNGFTCKDYICTHPL